MENWSRKNSDGTSTPLLEDGVATNAHGEWVHRRSSLSQQAYGYDKVGRLSSVTDLTGTACTVRLYAFDANSNRTHKRDATGPRDACPSAPALGTAQFTYDGADRLTTGERAYDAFGRTTKLPGTEAIEYFTNDLVRGVRKSAQDTQTWTLDPAERLRSWTRTTTNSAGVASTVTKTNHYGADVDSPDWISETADPNRPITRFVSGLDGDMVATTARSGGIRLQLSNLHGDVAVEIDSTGSAVTYDSDEFGNPKGVRAGRYGWLGAAQRSHETPNGTMLMGVRLYDPAAGRFLQVDPVAGGSANDYDYSYQDPVNVTDLTGQCPPCVAAIVAARIGAGLAARRAAQQAAVRQAQAAAARTAAAAAARQRARAAAARRAEPRVPRPRYNKNANARHRNSNNYRGRTIGYVIRYRKGGRWRIWKYGISSSYRPWERPERQIPSCARKYGRCRYQILRTFSYRWHARTWEYGMIWGYWWRSGPPGHRRCPPGQPSCR